CRHHIRRAALSGDRSARVAPPRAGTATDNVVVAPGPGVTEVSTALPQERSDDTRAGSARRRRPSRAAPAAAPPRRSPVENPTHLVTAPPPSERNTRPMSVIHVATTGSDTASGSADDPLRTIQRAAELATPGTTVVVHGGVYREWVRPPRGGRGEDRRIVFQAAEGEHVRITGSERVTGWERADGDVWRVTLPNGLFGERNPFAIEVAGDWLIRVPGEPAVHLGEVYLEGRSGYEVSSREAVADPDAVPLTTVDRWTGRPGHERDPEQVQQRWYAEVGEDAT